MNNELRFDFLTKSEFFLDFYELRQTFIYQFHEKDEIYKIYVPKKSGSEINVYQVCKNSDIYPEWFNRLVAKAIDTLNERDLIRNQIGQ